MRYSALKVLKEALTGNKGWQPVWREPEPKPAYHVIVIGGGGHGLATVQQRSRSVLVKPHSHLTRGNMD